MPKRANSEPLSIGTEPLDYQAWLHRAWNFIDECRRLPDEVSIAQIVEPPASRSRFERALDGLSRPIPRCLERWFREGSSYCHLSYYWQPRARGLSPLQKRAQFRFGVGGEVKIGPLSESEIGFWIVMCGVWIKHFDGKTDPASRRALTLWDTAFPFCVFGDGDMLAAIPSQSGPERIVYLIHDNPAASFILAPSFDEFLRRWEELRYCDQTGLCFFRRRGQLDPSSPAAVQLRDWLPGNEDC